MKRVLRRWTFKAYDQNARADAVREANAFLAISRDRLEAYSKCAAKNFSLLVALVPEVAVNEISVAAVTLFIPGGEVVVQSYEKVLDEVSKALDLEV